MALVDARNSLAGDELTRPLAPDLRQRLGRFLVAADERTTPATKPQIEAEVAVLMMAFHTARTTSKAEAAATMAVYSEVLVNLPLWAIQDGFAKIKAGEVEGASPDFPPAAPRLRQVVTEEMRPLLQDRYAVRKVLAARQGLPDDPEMAAKSRARVRAMNEERSKQLTDLSRIGDRPAPPGFKALQGEALAEHYRTHGFLFKPKPPQRNADETLRVTDDVTFQDDATFDRRAVGG